MLRFGPDKRKKEEKLRKTYLGVERRKGSGRKAKRRRSLAEPCLLQFLYLRQSKDCINIRIQVCKSLLDQHRGSQHTSGWFRDRSILWEIGDRPTDVNVFQRKATGPDIWSAKV